MITRRDKAFNTLNSAQRKEIFQMSTTDRRVYIRQNSKTKRYKIMKFKYFTYGEFDSPDSVKGSGKAS